MRPTLFDKLSQLWRRLLFYMRRDRFDRELEEEMRFHLEIKLDLKTKTSPTSSKPSCSRTHSYSTSPRRQA